MTSSYSQRHFAALFRGSSGEGVGGGQRGQTQGRGPTIRLNIQPPLLPIRVLVIKKVFHKEKNQCFHHFLSPVSVQVANVFWEEVYLGTWMIHELRYSKQPWAIWKDCDTPSTQGTQRGRMQRKAVSPQRGRTQKKRLETLPGPANTHWHFTDENINSRYPLSSLHF